jgi:signal transduction histidine kinase
VTRACESRTDIEATEAASKKDAAVFDEHKPVDLTGRRATSSGCTGLPSAERQMLSRELHDRVAHAIAAGVNSLELSEHYTRNGRADQAQAKLADARRTLRHALEVTKELAARVRFPRAAERPRTEAGRRDRRPPLDSAEVFLILREAVHNALTHSGASQITIRLSNERGAMSATVDDDGSGPAAGGGHGRTGLGLRSMHERAQLLGGTLNITGRSAGGTRVVLDIPLQP